MRARFASPLVSRRWNACMQANERFEIALEKKSPVETAESQNSIRLNFLYTQRAFFWAYLGIGIPGMIRIILPFRA